MAITKESALFDIARMFDIDERKQATLYKEAFTPMYPGGSTPPEDPAAAGAPPMDPAAAAGAPPMDPAAAGGIDPAMMQQMQDMMAQQGGAGAPPPPAEAPAPAGAPRGEAAANNGEFTGEEEKLSTDDKLDVLMQNQTQSLQMIQAIGDMLSAMLAPEDPAAVGGAPAGAPPVDPAMAAAPMDPAMLPPAEPVKTASAGDDFARSITNMMALLTSDD